MLTCWHKASQEMVQCKLTWHLEEVLCTWCVCCQVDWVLDVQARRRTATSPRWVVPRCLDQSAAVPIRPCATPARRQPADAGTPCTRNPPDSLSTRSTAELACLTTGQSAALESTKSRTRRSAIAERPRCSRFICPYKSCLLQIANCLSERNGFQHLNMLSKIVIVYERDKGINRPMMLSRAVSSGHPKSSQTFRLSSGTPMRSTSMFS